MEVECPKCNRFQDVDHDDLPRDACDDKDFECNDCEHVFTIGWIAEVEVRQANLTIEGDKP